MSKKAKTVQNIKSAKTIRNVLVQPFKTVWPSVDTEDSIKLVKMLNELPSAQVVHGTNPVSHLLSQGQAHALFITSDFHPQILGKQIIQMARRNCPKIPILAPESLKWGEKLEKLVAIRTTSGVQPAETTELLKVMAEIIKSKEYDKDLIASKSTGKKVTEEPKTVERVPPAVLPRPHLMRSPEQKRVFIPPVSTFATKLTSAPKEDWGEYISLKRSRSSEVEKSGDSKDKKKSKQKPGKPIRKESTSYIPLTVNRVQGNPNRKADKKKQQKNK